MKTPAFNQFVGRLRPQLASMSRKQLATVQELAAAFPSQPLCLDHKPLSQRAGVRVDGPYHLQNVNGYHSRFKGWLAPFRGVASRYLQNFLGWRRALDTRSIGTPGQFWPQSGRTPPCFLFSPALPS